MSIPASGARSRAAICDTTLATLVATRGAEPPAGAAGELARALEALGADVLDASARAWLRAAARGGTTIPVPRLLEHRRS